MVRHYGRQAVAVKLDREANEKLLGELGVTETPALVVMKPDGKVVMTLAGKKLKTSAIAKELRKIAKDKTTPKTPGVFVHR